MNHGSQSGGGSVPSGDPPDGSWFPGVEFIDGQQRPPQGLAHRNVPVRRPARWLSRRCDSGVRISSGETPRHPPTGQSNATLLPCRQSCQFLTISRSMEIASCRRRMSLPCPASSRSRSQKPFVPHENGSRARTSHSFPGTGVSYPCCYRGGKNSPARCPKRTPKAIGIGMTASDARRRYVCLD
jgi:hypothetical protein